MGCLYRLTSPSQKSYFGITKKTAEERWRKHKEHALGKRDSGALYSALRKYGPDSFTLHTVVVCNDWETLCELEKHFIAYFGTISPGGYNIAGGGGFVHGRLGERARQNISIAQKKRFQDPAQRALLLEYGNRARAAMALRPRKVRPKPEPMPRSEWKRLLMEALQRPEVRQRTIECARNRAANPEWRKKISLSKSGRILGPHGPEWNNHIAEARRREWTDPVLRAKRLKALEKAREAKKLKQWKPSNNNPNL